MAQPHVSPISRKACPRIFIALTTRVSDRRRGATWSTIGASKLPPSLERTGEAAVRLHPPVSCCFLPISGCWSLRRRQQCRNGGGGSFVHVRIVAELRMTSQDLRWTDSPARGRGNSALPRRSRPRHGQRRVPPGEGRSVPRQSPCVSALIRANEVPIEGVSPPDTPPRIPLRSDYGVI